MHPDTSSATDTATAAQRIAWALWQSTGLSLVQLQAQWPWLPWQAIEDAG